MKTEIEVSGIVELEYDENSKEFKETLEGFRECINRNGTKEDVLKHVAFYTSRFGANGMIEGVGYVSTEYGKAEYPDSGIKVITFFDDNIECEIL
jgi:hypothetical protein